MGEQRGLAPLLTVDLAPVTVELNLRESGARFPCKWSSVLEIYNRIAIFEEVSQMINEILQEESCFTLKNLAVNGHDMMTLGFQGPTIGRVLQECLDAVLDEQIPNEHEALMAFAKDRQLKS